MGNNKPSLLWIFLCTLAGVTLAGILVAYEQPFFAFSLFIVAGAAGLGSLIQWATRKEER